MFNIHVPVLEILYIMDDKKLGFGDFSWDVAYVAKWLGRLPASM